MTLESNAMVAEPSECPSENELLAWASGRLAKERVAALDVHIDDCATCRALVGEALRNPGDSLRSIRRRDHTFSRGDLVAERYEVVGFLGQGGMGEVYEVHDQWLKDAVALKTLIAPIADDASALARLKAEVLLARRVSHQNVCRIFDLGYHDVNEDGARDRVAFLTMELLRGQTLKTRLGRGRLSVEEAQPIARQILAGLGNAHDVGVIHRDLKSDNVMLVDEQGSIPGRVVVTDFGLARSLLMNVSQPLTSHSHQVLGTLDYMAPEQLEGKPATERSDIYAFGIVLFEMLVGRLPVEGESAMSRAFKRLQSELRLPSAVASEIDPMWGAIVSKCLARNPSERFRHVSEIARLFDAGAGAPQPKGRKNRAPIAVALVLAAGAGVALAVSLSKKSSVEAEALAGPDVARSAATISPSAEVPIAPPEPMSASRTPEAPSAAASANVPPPAASQASRLRTPQRAAPGPRPAAQPSVRPPRPAGRAGPAGDGVLDPFAR